MKQRRVFFVPPAAFSLTRSVALHSISIFRNSAFKYETTIQSDEFLRVIHGGSGAVERTCETPGTDRKADVGVYFLKWLDN